MKPPTFAYAAPRNIEAATALLATGGASARILAGGQSLVPAMNFRLSRPDLVIDINRIPELAFIGIEQDLLAIGAMTRQRAIETSPLIAQAAPLLQQATGSVAHLPIRTRGTLGGSLAHADPAAEYPAVALALDARMIAQRGAERRTIAAADFFRGVFTTALLADELLVEIHFPRRTPQQVCAFEEHSRRKGDFALAGVAVCFDVAGHRAERARIAVCGVGPHAQRLPDAEALLQSGDLSPAHIAAVAQAAMRMVDPPSDLHAAAAYRRHLLGVLVRRAIARAMAA